MAASVRLLLLTAAALLLWPALAPPAAAQEERPVRWTLEADSAAEDGARTVRLSARIEEGWYLYSPLQPPGGPIPLAITVPEGAAYGLAGEIAVPRPRRYADRNFDIFSQIYERSAVFGMPMRQAAGSTDGTVRVHARYQACTRTYCLPPRTDTVHLALAHAGARPTAPAPVADVVAAEPAEPAPPGPEVEPAVAPPAGEVAAATAPDPVEPRPAAPIAAWSAAEPGEALLFGASAFGAADSLARFLWLAALMGLLSLLTPCVFPMVPITVGFFTRAPGSGGGGGLLRAGAYGAGIVATFSALGLGVAIAFGAGGVVRLAANPWLNLAVAAMFVAFAINLMGAYEIRLPQALVARAARAGGTRRGAGAAFAMGGAFTLTSFTCTAPFVGTLLVLGTQGDWQWPLLGLTVYAAAFALPFFLLALMPDALSRFPRSGPWLHTLRISLGIVELAAAAKFLSNADLVWKWGVLTREAVIGVWVVACLALTALFAVHAWRAARARAVPLALAAVSLAAALYLGDGVRGGRLGELEAFLPPAREGTLRGGGELPWRLNDYEGSLALAQAEGKPLLLDFTGYTCTNCHWMEANMFPREEVRDLLDGFVRVRLYTDGQGEVYERQQRFQQQRFGTVALPYYAVVDPGGRPVAAFLGMTRDAREFGRFLRTASASAGGGAP